MDLPLVDVLAVVDPGRAALDVDRARLFLARQGRVDVIDLATGKTLKWLDAGGELWPAGAHLVSHRVAFPGVSVVVIDPIRMNHVASCSIAVDAPKGSQARIDVFATAAGAFVKWESSPQPDPPQGAAMTDADINEWQRRFQATYRCGVLALRVEGASCRLETVPFAEAGLESCETRRMPPRRLMPVRIGDLHLKMQTESKPEDDGTAAEIHTLTVTGQRGSWSVETGREILLPPPP